ncbi:MAG: NUDIX domain-containing protein [Bacteroidaceae bacterium]|nr:NUDIX domain-containing protein [Bacteroidaceae bacterium]
MPEFYTQHAKVHVSVDCIVFGFDDKKLKLLIGRRKIEPGKGQWALYGGFVGADESLDDAAARVLSELTSIQTTYMAQVGTFGELNRAEGERVISVAYAVLINVKDYHRELLEQHKLEWVDITDIPPMFADHGKMISQAIKMLRRRISYEPLTFSLLPEMFTLTQLQNVYEAILDTELDKRNFRKRIKQMDYIKQSGLIDKQTSKRGAALYYLDKAVFEAKL